MILHIENTKNSTPNPLKLINSVRLQDMKLILRNMYFSTHK